MDDDPNHSAKATQEFLKVKQWNILQWPSHSPDLNPIEHAFHLLKTKLKAERPTNKQQQKSCLKMFKMNIMITFICQWTGQKYMSKYMFIKTSAPSHISEVPSVI